MLCILSLTASLSFMSNIKYAVKVYTYIACIAHDHHAICCKENSRLDILNNSFWVPQGGNNDLRVQMICRRCADIILAKQISIKYYKYLLHLKSAWLNNLSGHVWIHMTLLGGCVLHIKLAILAESRECPPHTLFGHASLSCCSINAAMGDWACLLFLYLFELPTAENVK